MAGGLDMTEIITMTAVIYAGSMALVFAVGALVCTMKPQAGGV